MTTFNRFSFVKLLISTLLIVTLSGCHFSKQDNGTMRDQGLTIKVSIPGENGEECKIKVQPQSADSCVNAADKCPAGENDCVCIGPGNTIHWDIEINQDPSDIRAFDIKFSNECPIAGGSAGCLYSSNSQGKLTRAIARNAGGSNYLYDVILPGLECSYDPRIVVSGRAVN